MMIAMRNKFKNNGMNIILWVALVSSLAIPMFFKKNSDKPWSININGSIVSFEEFKRELALNIDYVSAIRAQYGQFADYVLQNMGLINVKFFTVQELINRHLILQALDSTGIVVHHLYVGRKIHDKKFVSRYLNTVLPVQLIGEDGTIDQRFLNQYLQRRGMRIDEFQEQVAHSVESVFFNALFKTFSYVPKYVREYEALQKNGLKTFSVVSLQHEDFLKKVKDYNPSDEEITSFYEKENTLHQRYYVPEKRSGIQWKLSADLYGLTVTDNQAEAYYELHKTKRFIDKKMTMHARQIVFEFKDDVDRAAQKEKVDNVYEQLKHNQLDFEDAVQQYSTDIETAKKGGLVEPFSRGQKDRIFERATFVLKKDGDISSVIESDSSYIIIQRVKKESQTYKDFKEVHSSIKKTLRLQAFSKVFVAQAKKNVSEGGQAVQDFIKEHNGVRSELTSLIKDSSSVARTLFSLKEDAYSVYEEGGNGYIVQLTSIEKEHMPSVEAIKNEVRDDIYDQKALNMLEVTAKEIHTNFENTNFEITSIEALSSTMQERFADIRKIGIDPLKILSLEKEGSFITIEDGNDRYIVRLDSINYENDTSNLEKKEEIQTFTQSFIASLRRTATIEINEIMAMIEEDNTI